MSKRARNRRIEWLAKRHDRMLTKPRPIKVGYINCGAASWPNRPEKVARILRRASEHCRILHFSEAFNVDAAKVLAGWDVFHDTSTGARAGSGVAILRKRGRIKRRKLVLLVTARLNGRWADRMRDRWGAKAVHRIDPGTPHRWTLRSAAVHAPPARNKAWWEPFMRRASRLGVQVLCGDWNAVRSRVKDQLGGDWRLFSHGIDAIAVAAWIPTGKLRTFDVGSDHPLLVLQLFARRKR